MTHQPLTLLGLHAHPDDEIFTMGGTLVNAHERGFRTVLVYATRGEEGEIHDPDLDPLAAAPRLAEIRTGEMQRAAAILRVSRLEFLGYRDSGMAGTEANANPSNFHNADLAEAVGRTVALIREERPDVVLTYDERGGYGHPDHIKANQLARAAIQAAADASRYPGVGGSPWQVPKFYYAVWSREAFEELRFKMRERGLEALWDSDDDDAEEFLTPDAKITTTVDVRRYVPEKIAALRAHRTQVPETDQLWQMPDDLRELFLGTESFSLVHSTVGRVGHESDVFQGLERHQHAI